MIKNKESKFSKNVLMLYAYELIVLEFEPEINNLLEKGLIKDWKNIWHNEIDRNIIIKCQKKAIQNNYSDDFSDFRNFRRVLDFSDAVQIIVSIEKQNSFFHKFFKEKFTKQTLLQSQSRAYRIRCLVSHNPEGVENKNIYIADIKDFLEHALKVCEILRITNLSLKYEKLLKKSLEDEIINSKFYDDEIETVSHNLPIAEYEEWSGLVGRDFIKKEIISDFNRGNNRIIAIIGGGGVGKSALALEICREFLNPSNWQFNHLIWITSKNNFLDYSGIETVKPNFYYEDNYKDFLNLFISGFYGELYTDNLDKYSEHELENDAFEILNKNSRILLIIDNLENINDSKILNFIKEKIIPPNFALITSRKGLGEINKVYQIDALDDDSALILFNNFCKFYKIEINKIESKILKEYVKKTQNYPLVIKWCLSIVAFKKMELTTAFDELNATRNDLLDFLFPSIYKDLSKDSKTILQVLALYKEIPDRNIISYIAEINNDEQFIDAIFELEKYSLIKQDRIPAKNGTLIIETLEFLGLTQKFVINILNSPSSSTKKNKLEQNILSIEKDLEQLDDKENDYTQAQKLAQSKLLKAYKIVSGKGGLSLMRQGDMLIYEAERLAPRFHLTPFYRALILQTNLNYDFGSVRKLLLNSINLNGNYPKAYSELGNLTKKHKPESSQYITFFKTAFILDPSMLGNGLAAAQGYLEFGFEDEAVEIVNLIKDNHSDFPKDDNQKFIEIRVNLFQIENELTHNLEHSLKLLNDIQENIEYLGQINNKQYRFAKAKYYSLFSLINFIVGKKEISIGQLSQSNNILDQYRGNNYDRHSYLFKEIVCINWLVEYYLKDKKEIYLDKLEFEMNGDYRPKLSKKFKVLKKYCRALIK